MLTVAECVYLACVLEATARKPGSVHRYQNFDDLTYLDFLLSAGAAAPILGTTAERGVGVTVRDAVRQTRRFVNTNTNLGIVLLLAPLTAVPSGRDLARCGGGAGAAHGGRFAGGLRSDPVGEPRRPGTMPEQDVRDRPTLPLHEVMGAGCRPRSRSATVRERVSTYSEIGASPSYSLSPRFRGRGLG